MLTKLILFAGVLALTTSAKIGQNAKVVSQCISCQILRKNSDTCIQNASCDEALILNFNKNNVNVSKGVSCTGDSYSAKSTGYYPADDPVEGGYYDCMGNPLATLQGFINGDVSYVSVAMDEDLQLTYGTKICIPEINDYYGTNIEFRVSDTGSAFTGKGFTRIDICVQDEAHSYDDIVNGQLTLIFPDLATGSPCCGC